MSGARDAAERLARAEAPALLRYFERRCDEREDAADLLGDTLLVIWRRAEAIPSDETQARMWAYGIARRVLGTWVRGRRRRLALADRLRDELRSSPRPQHDAASTGLRAALESLSERDREIIRLVAWDGFSLADVARHLRTRPGTVRSRYSRARAALRLALVDPSVEEDEPAARGGPRASGASDGLPRFSGG